MDRDMDGDKDVGSNSGPRGVFSPLKYLILDCLVYIKTLSTSSWMQWTGLQKLKWLHPLRSIKLAHVIVYRQGSVYLPFFCLYSWTEDICEQPALSVLALIWIIGQNWYLYWKTDQVQCLLCCIWLHGLKHRCSAWLRLQRSHPPFWKYLSPVRLVLSSSWILICSPPQSICWPGLGGLLCLWAGMVLEGHVFESISCWRPQGSCSSSLGRAPWHLPLFSCLKAWLNGVFLPAFELWSVFLAWSYSHSIRVKNNSLASPQICPVPELARHLPVPWWPCSPGCYLTVAR
jgi:hypothetical protein